MNTARTTKEWREFVSGCLDFRPEEGVYRVARRMFTEPELFELEMEMIFEKNWIYACYESEIARPNDFITMRAGRQPMIITSDKGFVFITRDTEGTESLEDYLGDAKVFLDLMVAQSPTGELEVLPGKGIYTFDGNWKLQTENGLDGYHVSTVHYNYVATVQRRTELNAEKGAEGTGTLDYRKLGAGDAETDDGWFSFRNGHSVLFSEMPNPKVRPGYATIMPRLVEEYGQQKAEWMMHRLRNLNVYPSLFFMDQISSQLRIIRPVAWNKTEVISQCIGVKGESDKDRENRIRQFEDFFNVSGMGTPDDLVEFREAQRGFQARLELWNDISRGHTKWATERTPNAEALGISPVLTGTELTHEGLYVNQHGAWQNFLLQGLDRKSNIEQGAQ